MNVKYKKYIDYIVSDIELPYIKYLNMYGLKQDEMDLVLSKVFNQPVLVRNNNVYDTNDNMVYFEDSDGFWVKREYDTNVKLIYYENSRGEIIDNRYE